MSLRKKARKRTADPSPGYVPGSGAGRRTWGQVGRPCTLVPPLGTLFGALSDAGRLLSVPSPPFSPQSGPAGRLHSLLLQLGRNTSDLDASPQVGTSLLPGRAEPREQCLPGVRSCVGKCVLQTPHQLVRWLCSLLTRSVLHIPWEITPISTTEMFFIDGEKYVFDGTT